MEKHNATLRAARLLARFDEAMNPLVAHGVALLAALAWGIGGVPQKTVLDHLDPFTVTGFTCLIGALVVLPFAWREARRRPLKQRPHPTSGFAVALVFALAVTLSQFGYGLTSVTNAGFFCNTAAVITPFAAWAIYKQRPQAWIFPASMVTAAGLFMMGGGGLTPLSLGDILCLASALCFAIWMIMIADHLALHRNPNGITCHQLAFCGAASLAIGISLYGVPSAFSLREALPELLIIGAISRGLAYCLSAAAQQYIHPSSAAVLVSAEALFGSLFAVLLIGETISLAQAAGAALVMAGIIMVSAIRNPAHAPRKPSSKSA